MFSVLRYPSAARPDIPAIATLGNFDGVHLGHQALLQAVGKYKAAQGADVRRLLVSFYPHPALVLKKAQSLRRLSDLHDERRILQQYNIDGIYLVRFTSAISSMSAEEFMNRILIGKLNVCTLIIGPDARVGRGGEGTAEIIRQIMQKKNRNVEIMPFCQVAGDRISSRKIRDALAAGEIAKANQYLGRAYTVRGRVVHGAGRGKQLGIATANLAVLGRERQLPANGVYACRVALDGKFFDGVANLGVRPTFPGKDGLVLEVHMLDFPAQLIYDRVVELYFLDRLRDEMKFGSKEELLKQIKSDIDSARVILAKARSYASNKL